MIGRTIRIPNSCYRMIPNPTAYHWDKKYFSIRKLLQEFRKKIGDDDLVVHETVQIDKLRNWAEKVTRKLKVKKASINLELLDTLTEVINNCDDFLKNTATIQMVELVLREHCQEVLRMVNYEDNDDYASYGDGEDDPGDPDYRRRHLRFNDLMTASPEEKQEKLMDLYFAVLLPRVMRSATQALRRSKASTLMVPHGHHEHHSSVDSTASSMVVPSRHPSPEPGQANPVVRVTTPDPESGLDSAETAVEGGGGSGRPGHQQPSSRHPPRPGVLQRQSTTINERQATEVWCTLVFRSLCWLMLHDFNKKDVQVAPKSELYDSRLPVYIV